jgi:protein SCO1/2
MKRVMPFSDQTVLLVLGAVMLIYLTEASPRPLPMPVSYPSVNFITQDGKDFSLLHPRSKYTIAGFFFTSCPTICPRMTRQMKRVQDVIKSSSKYTILFYSLNPKGDTPQKLSDYARRYAIDSNHWLLLAGKEKDIRIMSAFYAVRGEPDENDPASFIHDGQFLLTNNQTGSITRYLGTDSASVDKLIAAVLSDL